jgi:phage terminase Nu1 subunit (DNA packaging protein)
MFGFAKTRPTLNASDVARWLAKHARDVAANSREDAVLFARASLALSSEQERLQLLVGEVLRQ